MKVSIAGIPTTDQPLLRGTNYAILLDGVLHVNPDGYPTECCIISMPKTEYTLTAEFKDDANLVFHKNIQRMFFPGLFTPKF